MTDGVDDKYHELVVQILSYILMYYHGWSYTNGKQVAIMVNVTQSYTRRQVDQ